MGLGMGSPGGAEWGREGLMSESVIVAIISLIGAIFGPLISENLRSKRAIPSMDQTSSEDGGLPHLR